MTRDNRGFTILEIVVVMVLISIIAAATFTRSITTDQINFVGQVDKIRQHIRYAQSLAMKSNEIWGIESNATQYWLFKNNTSNEVQLPGVQTAKISLSDLGITMNNFTVYFNKKFGVPWKSITFGSQVEPDNPLFITITAGTESVTFSVTPETGLLIRQ